MINQRVSIEGIVEIIKISPRGKKVVCPPKKNLILDNFFTLITNSSNTYVDGLRYCYVGTGNSTPSTSQTQLDNQFGSPALVSSISEITSGSSPYFTDTIFSYTFVAGTFNGEVIKEIGLGGNQASVTASGLLTRTLIQPDVVVLSDEALQVRYTMRLSLQEAEVTNTVEGYTFVTKPARASAPTSWYINGDDSSSFWMRLGQASDQTAYQTFTLSSIDSDPVTTNPETADTIDTLTYPTSTSMLSAPKWGLTSANYGSGVAGFTWGTQEGPIRTYWQTSVSPTIPKTVNRTLAISFSVELVRT